MQAEGARVEAPSPESAAKERVKEIEAAAEERATRADERMDTAEEAIAQTKKVISRLLTLSASGDVEVRANHSEGFAHQVAC